MADRPAADALRQVLTADERVALWQMRRACRTASVDAPERFMVAAVVRLVALLAEYDRAVADRQALTDALEGCVGRVLACDRACPAYPPGFASDCTCGAEAATQALAAALARVRGGQE